MKTSDHRWDILIPSVVIRDHELKRLINMLELQVARYDGDIQVIIYWNNFEKPISIVRQALLEASTAMYVSFIDDDDEVPPYYCQEIYKRLDGVDYIGFKMQFYKDGVLQKPVIHSIDNNGWFEDDTGFYRQATYLNPVRRELAMRCRFDVGTYAEGVAEDISWADQLSKLLQTEHFINRDMYMYWQRDGQGTFRRTEPEDGAFARPVLPEFFHYHPDSTESQ